MRRSAPLAALIPPEMGESPLQARAIPPEWLRTGGRLTPAESADSAAEWVLPKVRYSAAFQLLLRESRLLEPPEAAW